MITLTLESGQTITIEHLILDGPSTVVLSDDTSSLGGYDAKDTPILTSALREHRDAHVHDTEEAPLAEASVRYDASTSTLCCDVYFHAELVPLTPQDREHLADALTRAAATPPVHPHQRDPSPCEQGRGPS